MPYKIYFLPNLAEEKSPTMKNNEIYKALRLRIEKVTGRKMKTPRDFDYLSTRIFDTTKSNVAPITLKRFWGYIGNAGNRRPFRSTLNILAMYVGYADIDAFENTFSSENAVESDFLLNDSVQTISLQKGTRIELKWYPDRHVVISYEGLEMFKVVESVNSKLSVGDTFMCGQIIDGEPLNLRCLVHNGEPPVNYVCGRVNGVKYKIF